MAERDRLGGCRWVKPGRRRVDVPLGLLDQRVGQLDEPAGHAAGVVAQVQPQVGGDLVVAGPAGAQLAAERAEPLQQAAFERGVHVLVVDGGPELAGRAGRLQVVQRGEHAAQLVGVEQAGPGQHPGVRPGGGQVVRGQPPVELHAHRQPGQRLGRPAGEPPTPQPGRSRLVGSSSRAIMPRHVTGPRVMPPALSRGRPGRRPSGWAGPTARRSPGQRLVERVARVVGGQAEVVQAGRASAAR